MKSVYGVVPNGTSNGKHFMWNTFSISIQLVIKGIIDSDCIQKVKNIQIDILNHLGIKRNIY